MADLYGDEDFSFAVVEELRKLGHDVLTAQEAGQGNQGAADSKPVNNDLSPTTQGL